MVEKRFAISNFRHHRVLCILREIVLKQRAESIIRNSEVLVIVNSKFMIAHSDDQWDESLLLTLAMPPTHPLNDAIDSRVSFWEIIIICEIATNSNEIRLDVFEPGREHFEGCWV